MWSNLSFFLERHPKIWWSAEVKKRLVKDVRQFLPLTQVMKIARLISPLPDMFRLLSSRPRLRHGRRAAPLSPPNLTLNLCNLSFVLLLALLPHLPSLLTSPITPLPGSRLRSSPITRDPTFLTPSQRPCVAEQEAIFPSSAEPHVLRSLTRPFAVFSPPLNFLRLRLTFSCLLPLAQIKLPIPW